MISTMFLHMYQLHYIAEVKPIPVDVNTNPDLGVSISFNLCSRSNKTKQNVALAGAQYDSMIVW